MSHEEEPRNQHLTDNCSHCEEDYDLTPNNTALRNFTKKPECNYLYAICTCCGGQTQIYIQKETTEAVLAAGIPSEEDEYPQQDEYLQWCEVHDIKLIEPHEISPRQENFIKYFGYLLKNNLFDPIMDKFI